MNRDELLDRIAEIRVWKRADERAVSKPLLLLYALAQCARGVRDLRFCDIDPVIQGLLREFGPHRQSYRPEYPFWRLQSDDLWEVEDANGLPRRQSNTDVKRSVLLEHNIAGRFPEEIYSLLVSDQQLVNEIAHSILDAHFVESTHEEILSAVGLSVDRTTSGRRRRDPTFRSRVLNAYEHRCAICGFRGKPGPVRDWT
jgi:putative restriction endonuclease